MAMVRRRRRWRPGPLVAAIVVTLIAILAFAGARSGKRPDPRLGWIDEVRPLVSRSNQLGLELTDLRSSIGHIDRPTLSRRVDRLEHEAKAILTQVNRTDAPDTVATAKGLLVAVMAVRVTAITGLQPALDAALGTGAVKHAAQLLTDVGESITLSDHTYAMFVKSLPKSRRSGVLTSQWAPDPAVWEQGESTAFVTTLRSSASLSPVHDVALVTFSTDPPATGTEGPLSVLPFEKTMRVQIVVANVGNESEKHLTITATLTPTTGPPDSARQFVDLAPGQRRTVQVGGLRPIANDPTVLEIRIDPVSAESNVEDNEVKRTVVFR